VHDYIHQCKALHDMCLYDWIARCEQTKIPKKLILNRSKKDEDDGQGVTEGESSVDECSSSHPNFHISKTKLNVFPLLLEHPLAETHGTRCCPVIKEKVLNFVGSTLPRYDQGDCEYYCSVMLTLFKPWQSGLELKIQEQSWDDAFSTHKFSAKHQYIMRDLNIQYKCLDAQDDFHAQLNKGDFGISSWDDPDVQAMEDMDKIAGSNNVDIVQDDLNGKHHIHDVSVEPGKHEKAQTHLMSEMRATLHELGWMVNIPGSLNPVVHGGAPPPKIKHSGAAWKMVVMQKHAEVLQLCSQNMPTNLNHMADSSQSNNQFVPDDVCIIKKSYLSCHFVSKEWQETIEDISTYFVLN